MTLAPIQVSLLFFSQAAPVCIPVTWSSAFLVVFCTHRESHLSLQKKNQKMIFPINYNGRKRTLTSVNLCFCFVCLSTISRPSSSRCFFLIRLNSLFMESFEPLSCELDESISIASKSKRCVNYE